MIRSFNYTKRQRIEREKVTITVSNDAPGLKTFDADIDLSDLKLPEEAHVYVEAYRRTSYMRFNFGTVAKVCPPKDRCLTEIDATEIIFFRVKIVDQSSEIGKILAEADGIPPAKNEVQEGNLCLLHVECRDLGEAIWMVEAEDPMPVLVLNEKIDGIREVARRDKAFIALVFPDIVKQILFQILIIDDHDPTENGDDWRSLWLRFIKTFFSDDCPRTVDGEGASRSEQLKWIEDAVFAYCRWSGIRETYNRSRMTEDE